MIRAESCVAHDTLPSVSDDAFGQLVDAVLRDGGMVAVIEAYFDESGTHAGSPIMCVAGYLFTPERAKRFDERWGSVLRQAGLKHFRMSECAGGAGQFKGWPKKHRKAVQKRLIGLVREHMTHGIAAWVRRAEFDRVVPPGWHAYYGGAYTTCLMQCVVNTAIWAKRAKYEGQIAYFFEAGDEHAGEAHTHMTNIVNDPEQRAIARYASHSFVTKQAARVFDAADLLAWHLNRLVIDSERRGGLSADNERADYRMLMEGQEDRYVALMLTRDNLKKFVASQQPPPAPEATR